MDGGIIGTMGIHERLLLFLLMLHLCLCGNFLFNWYFNILSEEGICWILFRQYLTWFILTNKWINRGENCGTYLIKVWRPLWDINRLENEGEIELSVNTVVFINWRIEVLFYSWWNQLCLLRAGFSFVFKCMNVVQQSSDILR